MGGAPFAVTFVNSSYPVAPGGTKGVFRTGEDADLVLLDSGFNDTGGPLSFNHPMGLASDGAHLVLADTRNNRVLVWNRLPDSGVAPDLVLGQPDFHAKRPGADLAGMDWPVAVATHGGKLVVADTWNDRLLVWLTFPSRNDQPADFALGGVTWPWAVWTDGARLLATSTATRQLVEWSTFPASGGAKPDFTLTSPDFGTPRSIGFDGTHLLVGDHNVRGKDPGALVWNAFPTNASAPADFILQNVPGDPVPSVLFGPAIDGTGRLWTTGNAGLLAWQGFPRGPADPPLLDLARSHPALASQSGDGSAVAVAGGRLYVSLYNGAKVVGWSIAPSSNASAPDIFLGSSDLSRDPFLDRWGLNNPIPASNGRALIVTSDFDREMYVWRERPNASAVGPDLKMTLPAAVWDNAVWGDTFVAAGQQTIVVWKTLPTDGHPADLVFQGRIGNVAFRDIRGIAWDGVSLFVSDNGAGKVYGWRGIPTAGEDPFVVLDVDQPWRVSSDGNELVVDRPFSGAPGGLVALYDLRNLTSASRPVALHARFNLPESAVVSRGMLFVADTGFSRVQVWTNVSAALAGAGPDKVLGKDVLNDSDLRPEIGRNKTFWPCGISWDGDYLWVGEFKFSSRLLRFSPR